MPTEQRALTSNIQRNHQGRSEGGNQPPISIRARDVEMIMKSDAGRGRREHSGRLLDSIDHDHRQMYYATNNHFIQLHYD